MADQGPELLSAEEVERWADILTEELLNPKSRLRGAILEGLGQPDLMLALAPQIRFPGIDRPLNPTLIPALPALRELIVSGNRDDIRHILRRMLSETPRTTLEWMRATLDPVHLRKFLLAEAGKFKGKQGPQPKLSPSNDKELISRADSLYPILLRVLRELELGTKHSVAEVLDFVVPDYESQVAYVRRHISTLEEALRNPQKHLKDAKRIETRARLLAAGLAGCDDGYAFNTSIEKVRQARRRATSPRSH
jgi:hypothetical protein